MEVLPNFFKNWNIWVHLATFYLLELIVYSHFLNLALQKNFESCRSLFLLFLSSINLYILHPEECVVKFTLFLTTIEISSEISSLYITFIKARQCKD